SRRVGGGIAVAPPSSVLATSDPIMSLLTRGITITVLLLAAVSCGSDERIPDVPPEVQAAGTDDLLSQIPPEELYGASPVDNIWSPLFEIEVPGLPRGWNGARLALISDFQLGLWEGNEAVAAAAVQHAIRQNPDAILLLGDYLAVGDDTTP